MNDFGAIVFTDIVGFTELTAIHGDDAALRLLARQDDLVQRELPSTGRVVKEIGDGLLLWFTDAGDAVTTSLSLQDAYEAESAKPDGMPLWVRIGIHWGSPKHRGDDIIGHDVNLASRIAALAGAGEVLCSDAAVIAAQRTGPVAGVCFAEIGPVVVKGIPEPVTVVRAERG